MAVFLETAIFSAFFRRYLLFCDTTYIQEVVSVKQKFCFFFLCLFLLSFSGCKAETEPTPRVVSGVRVDWQRKGVHFSRHYTDTKKVEALLLYLRLLKTEIPEADPYRQADNVYTITVRLLDGREHRFQQQQHRYFRIEQAPWQQIPPGQAEGLYDLLRVLESDL